MIFIINAKDHKISFKTIQIHYFKLTCMIKDKLNLSMLSCLTSKLTPQNSSCSYHHSMINNRNQQKQESKPKISMIDDGVYSRCAKKKKCEWCLKDEVMWLVAGGCWVWLAGGAPGGGCRQQGVARRAATRRAQHNKMGRKREEGALVNLWVWFFFTWLEMKQKYLAEIVRPQKVSFAN